MQPSSSRAGIRLILMILAATAFTACGDHGSSGTTASGQVRGTTWVTQELTVDGVRSTVPGGNRIELTFAADGTMRAHAGCNGMSGRYELHDDSLVVKDLAMTDMGCAADLMALDTTVATLLGARPTVTLAAGTLTVASATTMLTLVDLETVEPTPPLTATTWTLDTIITGDTASSLPQGLPRAITLMFDEKGTYTIATGCNGLGGSYTRDGTKLALEPGPTTLIGCPAPLDALEATIGRVFSGVVVPTVERQRLTVTAENGNGLGFTTKA